MEFAFVCDKRYHEAHDKPKVLTFHQREPVPHVILL
jgi:hypothetical protein